MLTPAEQDVARRAAESLSAKYGAKLPSLTEEVIAKGPPPAGSVSRNMVGGAELMQMAGLIVALAHLAVATYHASKDRGAAAKAIKEQMKVPAGMPGRQADEIVDAVVWQAEKQSTA